MSIADKVTEAIEKMGFPHVIYAAGAKDMLEVADWARAAAEPTEQQRRRIDLLLKQFDRVAEAESPFAARQWLINPTDGNISPLEAIRRDRFDEVVVPYSIRAKE